MNLPYNLFDGNVNIQTFLCQPDKTIIGEINPYNYEAKFTFNTYSEISFTIDRWYNDLIDGETKVNPYYEWVDSLRVIYLKGVGHFVIQDVNENVEDNTSKTVTCFSLEYSTGQKYLENFYVNTGEEGSVETMYHAQKYGAEYAIDNYYTKVTTQEFDSYQRYYIKEYSSTNAYNYVETQIFDSDDFTKRKSEEDLYIKTYPNVRFYWPSCKELSLLHLVFDRIPEWRIGHVDKELWYQERTFSEDRTSVYDFLYNTAADTLDFVIVWDSINGVANFYKTTEDGVTADEEIETQWDTNVFISRENLADSINIKYSADDIKTKLKISGSDNLDIRDVNLGQNYILNLGFYKDSKWLGNELYEKYIKYENLLNEKTEQYSKLISAWAAAYNEYSDLMNYVPVEPRVMMIGDQFDKLYCVYSKYVPATKYTEGTIYYSDTNGTEADPQPTTTKEVQDGKYFEISVESQVKLLQNKLHLYKVDQQNNGNRSNAAKTDDVLLTLENDASDSATIRVRYDVEVEGTKNGTGYKVGKENYCIYRTLTTASTGISNTIERSLEAWIRGDLTAENLNLSGFRVKSIGTLGAYLCIARDETREENVVDYGIRLLEEKKATYTSIFIAQTEGYMSKEGSQCIVSDERPTGSEIADGTKWLDSDDTDKNGELIMEIYKDGGWIEYAPSENQADYENYKRFYDNYQKLGVVQKVLSEKQLKADYLLNGVAVNDMYLKEKDINEENLISVARYYFSKEKEFNIEYNQMFNYLEFTIKSDTENKYAAYVINGTPYVSYAHSQGICLAKMDVIKKETDMNTYFTEGELIRLSPFIREDEYSDDNFLLTGYESEEEQMNIKQELLKAGQEELKKICQPKLSFTTTMANILSIPEFAPIKNQFKLGNFVRVDIGYGYIKRARLLEVNVNFDDISDFSCKFGDLISTKSEIDKHADLLKQTITAGKSVASNKSNWQRGADKATALDKAIEEGLQDATLQIGRASGQSIEIGQYGIRGRKLIEGTTDQYEDEQVAIINNKLVFTSDNWKSSKGVFGKFTIKDEDGKETDRWGVLADACVAAYIEGCTIKGGKLEIGGSGGKFVVTEDGSVQILASSEDENGNLIYSEQYASKDAIKAIDNAYRFRVVLSYNNSTVFSDTNDTCTITCDVYNYDDCITSIIKSNGAKFSWKRVSGVIDDNGLDDNAWNKKYENKTSNTIEITTRDLKNQAQFSCTVNFDENNV